MEHNERAVALTIAGFDGSGGAGILADVKVFEDLGCYGMAVASVLTVQNSLGVRATHPVEPEWVEAQLEAILSDGPVRAAKTGALGSVQQVRCVARLMAKWGVRALVVDPVMKASLGADLLDQPGIDALGEVTVRIEAEGVAPAANAQRDYEQTRTFGGHGADTDIIVASVKAYLAALNKMLVATGQYVQTPEVTAVLN